MLIERGYGEYEIDYSNEIKDLEFRFLYTTKYGEQYSIEGAKFDRVRKKGGAPKYQAYIVEASLNGNINLEIFIVFPNLLVTHKTPGPDAAINDMVKKVSILHAKIMLNEGRKGFEVVEIPLSQALNELFEQLNLKFEKVSEKKMGF